MIKILLNSSPGCNLLCKHNVGGLGLAVSNELAVAPAILEVNVCQVYSLPVVNNSMARGGHHHHSGVEVLQSKHAGFNVDHCCIADPLWYGCFSLDFSLVDEQQAGFGAMFTLYVSCDNYG